MPTSIELVKFDPYSTSTIELGPADEIIALDNRIYNKERQPYFMVRRETSSQLQPETQIWKITAFKLSGELQPMEISLTSKGKLFTFQRISESGARTGNYDSYQAWLVVADCSGKRDAVTIRVAANGESGFDMASYFATFGKMDSLFNLFVERKESQ